MKKKTPTKMLVTVVPLHKQIDPETPLGILKQCELEKSKLKEVK